jgi:outer membrane protein assembly factor BamA
MFGWRRRPASNRRAGLRSTRRALASVCGGALLAASTIAAAGPRLELIGPEPASGAWRTFFREDTAWLARQPAVRLAAPPPDSVAAVTAWIERALPRTTAAAHDTTAGALVPGRRDALAELRDRWIERGYLAATVALAASHRDSTTVQVAPGPLYRVGEVAIEGEDFAGRARLIAAVVPRSGDPFRPGDWTDAAQTLLAAAGEAGFPFARWVVQRLALDAETARVDVTAVLITGATATIGAVTSNLESARAQRFLIEASGLRVGEPFRESDLQRARERLEARDLYDDVAEPSLYLAGGSDQVGVHFRVLKRRKANRLAVVLGFNQAAEGGGRISGQVDLRLPNLAETGRRLEVQWSDDGRDRRRFGFGYLEPLAFGTTFDTELRVEQEVQTGVYTRFTLENRWQLPVVALWGLELGVGWDRNTYPVGELARTGRLRGRVAFYHRRGSRLRSGWSGTIALEEARRSSSYRADSSATGLRDVGTTTAQRIVAGDLDGELWIGAALSLFGRTSYRQLTGGGEPAPLAEQFRFGGARTLRGYREDEFRGETVAYGSVELRLGRPGRSRVYTFLDLGYFEFASRVPGDPARTERRSGEPLGFGVGLETRTPGGDISLAVGFPRRVNFDEAKLHVTLLESF